MSKKINVKFMEAYLELEGICNGKMNVSNGGATEYINRLNTARGAPGRDEAIPKLVRYRTIRNMLSHEAGAIKRDNGVSKSDIAWIKKFSHRIKMKRDPLSLYLKRARRFLRFRRIRKVLYWITVALFIIIVLVLGIRFF